MTSRDHKERQESGERRGRSAAEWITFAISVALILAIVGLVTYFSVTGNDQPPVIVAEPLTAEVRHEGNAYYLPIAVTNSGDQTAEAVLVEAELAGGAGAAASAEFTLDFLASGETAESTVVFATDPRAGELTVAVTSFQPP